MARHNKTGRSKTSGRFIMLPEYLLRSAAWRDASLHARCALVELLRRYNGTNNGSIVMGIRDLAGHLRCQKTRAAQSLLELEELGFIETKRIGGFARRNRKASEYLLTMFRCDLTGHLPSKAFMQHVSQQSLSAPSDNTVRPSGQLQDSCALRSAPADNEKAKSQQNDNALCPAQRTHIDIYHTPTAVADPHEMPPIPAFLLRAGTAA